MSDITTYQSVAISKLMNDLEFYKYNPSAMQQVIFNCLDEVTNGEVDIVDPTNPFVFLLEASTVNTALNNTEALSLHRKQYPSLVQIEDDIYLHMAGNDFKDRFGTPSETEFTVVIQVLDMYKKMVYDPVEDCNKMIIPRDTEFTVDNITFTMQYPIVIRRYANEIFQISYDATITSPLQTLTTNIIDYVVRTDSSQVAWIFFKVPVKQFVVNSSHHVLQLSSIFSQQIPYTGNYYYCRVFYKNTSTNNVWKEMQTTHTDQVFDPYKPTAVLKVVTGLLTVFIPPVYLNTQLISGDVRIDIYTTIGPLTINFNNYKLGSFQIKFKAIDEARDINSYTNALLDVSLYAYNDQVVSGGTLPVNFNTLREQVIMNSVGDEQLPITNVQIQSYVNNRGFDLVKNVDVITNRIFLATKKLPKPINDKLISAANIGISSILLDLQKLGVYGNIKRNGDRVTLLSNNIYLNDNGKCRLLTDAELHTLNATNVLDRLAAINSKQYVFTPFYYVLDRSSDEFSVRAYDLDYPTSNTLSFISQNQSLNLPVNTGSYLLEKVPTGYKLSIVTKSMNFYKGLGDNEVGLQVGFYPNNQTKMVYINGVLLSKNSAGERIFTVNFDTDYDLDTSDSLSITNAGTMLNETIDVWSNLSDTFHIFHVTTSLTEKYKPDDSSKLFGKDLLDPNAACVTHETLQLTFGTVLKNLWVRSRTFASGLEYKTYTEDVPLLYPNDVYKTDPVTKSIFSLDVSGNLTYKLLHYKGDQVRDTNDQPVFKHKKGDVVLDANGDPITSNAMTSSVEFDILLTDAKYYFATDSVFINYLKEFTAVINNWITVDLLAIQALLLEQTKIYYYSKTSLTSLKVFANEATEKLIDAEQSLIVDLYVKDAVNKNKDLKDKLTTLTIKTLDSYIGNAEVSISEMNTLLKTAYGENVVSVNVSNLGGSNNYNIVIVRDDRNRLCLKKKLILQQDATTIVQEDVTVNFHNVEVSLPTS